MIATFLSGVLLLLMPASLHQMHDHRIMTSEVFSYRRAALWVYVAAEIVGAIVACYAYFAMLDRYLCVAH